MLAAVSPLGAAPLDLADLSGQARSLDEYRGRIVILNFWATWCQPCREEMPILASAHESYRDRGVVVVGASADEEGRNDQVRKFVDEAGIGFPVWMGATIPDMQEMGLGEALPATAILDRDGGAVFRIKGPLTRDMLEERIDWMLSDRSAAPPQTTLNLHAAAAAEPAGEAHEHGHGAGHDHHEEEEAGGKGASGRKGASLVPS